MIYDIGKREIIMGKRRKRVPPLGGTKRHEEVAPVARQVGEGELAGEIPGYR